MMSLRAFHLFFIAISVVLAAFVAAWATGQYRAVHDASYAVGTVACIAAAIALAVYANAFRRKTREM
jgi:hypothetical protein